MFIHRPSLHPTQQRRSAAAALTLPATGKALDRRPTDRPTTIRPPTPLLADDRLADLLPVRLSDRLRASQRALRAMQAAARDMAG